jgi:cytochrome oxidase Cu insertion factor (SCO1/SenC/PrrC family)
MHRLRAIFVAAMLLLAFLPRLPFSLGLSAQTPKPAAGAPPLALKVGDAAPDFTLRGQSGKDVSLHDFQGRKTVVLAFYVFAFSGG